MCTSGLFFTLDGSSSGRRGTEVASIKIKQVRDQGRLEINDI